jgi:Ca2+-binding EF-hand superfamily protein
MRLMQRIQQLGEPGLEQRLRNAGDAATDSITLSQFSQFLTKIGMLPPDVLSIQRIVGFYQGQCERLKIADIMLKIMERASKRQKTEVDTLLALANDFKAKNYSIADAFAMLDTNDSGTITAKEL